MRLSHAGRLIGVMFAVLAPSTARAQTYEVLHSFNINGGSPSTALLASPDGRLFGAAAFGGRFGMGSVFVLIPNETSFDRTDLWEFSGPDGSVPNDLIRGSDGNFYGTTSRGGPARGGTVFRLTPAGTLTTIRAFSLAGNPAEGSGPVGLTEGSDGNFYGTTSTGGSAGWGTIFRITSGGVFSLLHAFVGADGRHPQAAPVQGTDGYLYGTTQAGGNVGTGTVFKMSTAGVLTTIHHFATSSGEGVHPYSKLVEGTGGRFYGTAGGGHIAGVTYCGSIFRIDSDGLFAVLHLFPCSVAGQPSGVIIGVDGALYGATASGGSFGFGTVYRLQLEGSMTVLHQFEGTDGIGPTTSLVQGIDGAFYGTTNTSTDVQLGETLGTVFRINATGGLTTLHQFVNLNGCVPNAGLLQADDGLFYGTTASCGAGGRGTVFRIDSSGVLTTLHRFRGPDGAYPKAALVQATDGLFYGTTEGGTDISGTVFRLSSLGAFATLTAFASPDAISPLGRLVQGQDGAFYGTTHALSGSTFGTVFKMDALGARTTLHSFASGSDGAYPVAGLVEGRDGNFYGTTSGYDVFSGGDYRQDGTIFRITPAGVLTTLHTFAEAHGRVPISDLLEGTDGKFYGTTFWGGPHDRGTIFRIDASGALTTLHSFSGPDGSEPKGGLIQGADGAFYGTTTLGGSGHGTVFRINSSGALTTLHAFTGSDGAYPAATLTQGDDGRFYGTTLGRDHYGTNADSGVIFRLTLPENTAAGSHVTVQDSSPFNPVGITFTSVSMPGTTSVAPIDPAMAGDIPGGFAVVGAAAYEIQTSAVFSGSITLRFLVPDSITETDFNNLVVLHNENGVLVDVTASSPVRDYQTRTIHAVASSLSPFYLARKGFRLIPLFDQSKAHKSGSTVPIRVRLLNDSGVNVSSPSIAMASAGLTRIGGNTSSLVIDSGNSNPDGQFRYDTSLGGYVLNLSTKGLKPGTWVLSATAGTDNTFRYQVRFEVK